MSVSPRDGKKSRRAKTAIETPDTDPEVIIEDISVVSDIEIIEDDSETAVLPIGTDLYLLPPSEEAVDIDQDKGDTTDSAPERVERQAPRLVKHFGPEVTAGIVIAALFVVFAVLMLLDVSGNDPADGEQQSTETAPVEVIEVEIGEGVTLERE